MKLNIKILITGLAIIILTNVVALGGVAYNRSGDPDAVVELTERELYKAYQSGIEKENTGLRLSISCRIETTENEFSHGNRNCSGSPRWLDKEKLIQLGFEYKSYDKNKKHQYSNKVLPKEAYLVLEYDGDTHDRALASKDKILASERKLQSNNPENKEFEERASQAQEQLIAEQQYNSRLFAIDAGLDRAALRKAYPEKNRYLMMKASIRPEWKTRINGHIWSGRITELFIGIINVPLEYRNAISSLEQGLRRNRKSEGPRFKVTVAFGKRSEPWVTGVEVIGKE